MKQQAIQYVALDVHQATLVASVRDEQGAVVMRATVATDAKAIVGLVRGLGARVHIAFEEGTQAQWLHDVLAPHVERVVVWMEDPGRHLGHLLAHATTDARLVKLFERAVLHGGGVGRSLEDRFEQR